MAAMQLENFSMHRAGHTDLPRLRRLMDTLGYEKDIDYFERQLEYQDKGERKIFIAQLGDDDTGYCILNWQPKYAFFKKLEIPEIQDLNVLPGFRRRGIATAMIGFCEDKARQKGFEHMGIGVGLHASYGAAQRLYVRLGYVPDGNGVTCDRSPVSFGEIRPLDDQMCLMMVKSLQNKA
jgi:GNAT superfamily N-acetyltransferase